MRQIKQILLPESSCIAKDGQMCCSCVDTQKPHQCYCCAQKHCLQEQTFVCDKSSERNADGVHKIPGKQEEEDRYNILRELVADVHKGKFLPDFLPPMLQSQLEELKRQKELP